MKKPTDFSVRLLADFIALTREGTPIADHAHEPCSHNAALLAEDSRRKDMFLSLGAAVMRELASRLGIIDASCVRTNRAGPAVSGDVYLSSPTYCVTMSHRTPRQPYGDVYFSPARAWRNTGWLKWEDLEDLDVCAARIKFECGTATSMPTEEP